MTAALDLADRRLVLATQAGLPLVPAPYAEIARWVDMPEAEVIDRLRALQDRGVIRRIAVAPNHYALGMTANGMSVWDVDDDAVSDLGRQIGAMPAVTHCYRRPRDLPVWPYNLFAMLHGHSRDEVEAAAGAIAARLGPACRGRDILYSTRILKKTGLRLKPDD